MHGTSIAEPISAPILALVHEALERKLAVCAGAGLSINTGLPSGRELAEALHGRFAGRLAGYTCSRPDHLPSVAAAVASLPSGLEALQRTIVDLARFDSAVPALGHRLLALLIADGALRLLTTNWDDCVERGWTGERIQAARDAAEAEELRPPHVLKIHGCCTRPATLLVTDEQLALPPLWTKGFFAAELSVSTMVFLGVGDVAPYVREKIDELARYVNGARVRVVSPGIVARWETSQWKDVLPDLPDDRRIAMSADQFLDEFARGWLGKLLDALVQHEDRAWAKACHDAFGCLSALDALSWLRRAAHNWGVGKSVAQSPEAQGALKAIGMLAQEKAESDTPRHLPDILFENPASVTVGTEQIEVLIAPPNQPTSELERAARRRAEDWASMSGGECLTVLCSANMPEGPRSYELDMSDVFAGDVDPDDVIAGPGRVAVRLRWADELLKGVA